MTWPYLLQVFRVRPLRLYHATFWVMELSSYIYFLFLDLALLRYFMIYFQFWMCFIDSFVLVFGFWTGLQSKRVLSLGRYSFLSFDLFAKLSVYFISISGVKSEFNRFYAHFIAVFSNHCPRLEEDWAITNKLYPPHILCACAKSVTFS